MLDHAAAAVQVHGLTGFHTKNAIALQRLRADFKGKVEILSALLDTGKAGAAGDYGAGAWLDNRTGLGPVVTAMNRRADACTSRTTWQSSHHAL
jgi:hypothetical protein